MKEEKCCGDCCWFYAEDTYGFGACPFQFAEVMQCDRQCNSDENFISKKEMRHHMAVLLQACRWHESTTAKRPNGLFEAAAFAYKYMKTFSEL